MKNKKLFSILCLTLTASMVLYGCSGTSSSSSTTENSTQEAEAQANTVTAQITKIDGSTVTATVGTLTTAQAPDGNDASNSEAPSGEAPAKPDDSNSSSDSNGAPGGQAPSGEAPAKPDDGNSSSDSNEAPGGQAPSGEATAKPDGDNANGGSSDGSAPSGEAPAKPDGDNANGGSSDNSGAPDGQAPSDGNGGPGGQAPSDGNGGPGGQMPGDSSFEASDETVTFTVTDDTAITVEFQQGSQEGTLDDLAENQVIEVELDDNNQAVSITVKNLQAGGGFGGSGEVTNGTAAASLEDNASVSGETYTSSGDDENALRADGVTASLNNVTIEKTGGNSSNTEDGDFYGQNAGFLALNGANVTITGATVNTSAINGNGVFSYGEGTTVTISDSTIHTTERNSGGIQTTGGGTTIASNLTVDTEGDSSAAIRSDRGGGTVNVDGGTYTTSGVGSPAVYSTADITVKNATLTANNSEGLVIEGKNSIALENCDVTGNMTTSNGGSDEDNLHAVMIYQSMSGDLFYVTNTSCTISLKDTKLVTANDQLLTIAGNNSSRGWGTSGSNGGDVVLTTSSQTMDGNITVDDISTLDMTLSDASAFTGTINSTGDAGEVNVTLDSSSTWTLTGDSYITSFDGDLSQINANGYQLYVNGSAVL